MVEDENLTASGNDSRTVGDGGIFTGSGVLATPLSLFFVQAMIIISLSRLLHFFLGKINQPRVVSEIIGGVCLGPSALGRIPGFLAKIFPDSSLANLSLVANLGLVFYLFMVGLELEPATFFGNLKKSLILAAAGIVVPLMMGAACSWGLYEYLSIGVESKMTVSFGSFALFIGTAMTITAFPVLARILTEKCMLTTQLGTMTISAAAIDDVLA
uniref:Cation/H+ exchanger domain-containing protein n=1 Tax=Romanomermis culicivorax TaxID=13658 RepID=A0A915HN23_ROMCU